MTVNGKKKKYDCTTCPYPRYKDRSMIFCDVCIRKILDEQRENMQIFCDRVQTQIEQTRAEQEKFKFNPTPFTVADCIPDMRNKSIVGKVVVINAEPKRYEYQHAAYQLVLAEGGNGATGGRGQAVFGTCLATGEHSRWERYDVLGEIKPERMPQWAKDALKTIQKEQKAKHSREER